MEEEIDPLQVLENIISTSKDTQTPEVPEDEYLESINSLAEELMEPVVVDNTNVVDPAMCDQGKTVSSEELPVNSVQDSAMESDPLAQAEDPLATETNALPLPSAPDFSFMDLLPRENPIILLDPPPLMTYNQNSTAGPRTSASKRSRKQTFPTVMDVPKKVLNQQFRSKLMSNIKQLSSVSQKEHTYRIRIFPDERSVLKKAMDCTICGTHIGCKYSMNVASVTHPLLKVLVCMPCKACYMQADWTLGPEGRDVRCRWCSKSQSRSNSLRNCSQCPFAFCQACVTRNFSKAEWDLTRTKPNWVCYGCQMIPFYLSRAVCWALSRFISTPQAKKDAGKYIVDVSTCCSKKKQPSQSAASSVGSHLITLSPGKNGTNQQQSFDWVRARVGTYFKDVESQRSKLIQKLNQKMANYTDKAAAVQEIVSTLTNIAGLTSNTSLAVHNWLRLLNSNILPVDEQEKVMTVLSGSAVTSLAQKEVTNVQKRPAPSFKSPPPPSKKPTPSRSHKKLPCRNWNALVKKYNIRPCYVKLERWVEPTPPEEEDLTDLLTPKVELRVGNVILDDDEEECILID